MDEPALITLVTGGARSGKSRFGEKLLEEISPATLYIATARVLDEEMSQRVIKHRQSRPASWQTLEAYRGFGKLLPEWDGKVTGVLLDCITLMITQIMLEEGKNPWEAMTEDEIEAVEIIIHQEMKELLAVLRSLQVPVVLITNEVGLGIVPGDKLSRDFRDIAGRINQSLAASADQVFLVVAGIPVGIK